MRAAAQLPAALSNWLYLEHRLGDRGHRVDFIVRVTPAGLRALAHAGLSRHQDAVWTELEAFLRRWAAPGCSWREVLAGIWIELDLPAEGDVLPAPRIFFDLRPAQIAAQATAPAAALSRALVPVEALLGRPPPAPLVSSLRACLARGAALVSIGIPDLLHGRWQPLRVCLAGIASEQLPASLAALGWPGDPSTLALPFAPPLALLDLDLCPRVASRIGLEYRLEPRGRCAGNHAFLNALVERGLCTEGARALLARWPADTIQTLPHELWPSLVRRRVNHVKLVHDGRAIVEAKGYLSLSHRARLRPAPGLYR